jgi:hypothetical protein
MHDAYLAFIERVPWRSAMPFSEWILSNDDEIRAYRAGWHDRGRAERGGP